MPCLTLGFHPQRTVRADTQQIISAKKLAYLLCPERPRLRLVDLDTEGDIEESAAIANLKHYAALLPDYPMIFAVENARQTATLTLQLAVAGGAKLTYDETNTYPADGSTVNPPADFWRTISMTDLTSVTFQTENRSRGSFRSRRRFCQLPCNCGTPKTRHYTGDLLLENTPTAHSLRDALRSREYLLGC